MGPNGHAVRQVPDGDARVVVAAGNLDKPFATEAAVAELQAMSAASVDRYLKTARDRMCFKGISTTKP